MRDIGNEETEKLIAEMEKKIRREYAQAEKELNEKFNEYVRKFKVKDEIKRQQLARGEITQEFYEYWRKGQFSIAFRWQEMRRTMADDLTTVSQKARSIVDGYRPEAYAINHDYITFLIEKDSGIDTSYTLYNTRSAERLLMDERVLPKPGKSMKGKIERGEVVKWQEGQIQSVTLQSLLQGESTENMAQRICRTLSVSNYADAVRYARTAMTGAQNGGRFDAISRCRDEGIDVVGQWSATLDGRTRHTHRQIDGEVAEPGEMFSNGCRFPGDPNGPPAEIWRCRCRLNERVRGYTKDPSDLTRRNTDHMEEDTYEEWKIAKTKKGAKK